MDVLAPLRAHGQQGRPSSLAMEIPMVPIISRSGVTSPGQPSSPAAEGTAKDRQSEKQARLRARLTRVPPTVPVSECASGGCLARGARPAQLPPAQGVFGRRPAQPGQRRCC